VGKIIRQGNRGNICKILCWGGGWLLGKKYRNEDVGKKYKNEDVGKKYKNEDMGKKYKNEDVGKMIRRGNRSNICKILCRRWGGWLLGKKNKN